MTRTAATPGQQVEVDDPQRERTMRRWCGAAPAPRGDGGGGRAETGVLLRTAQRWLVRYRNGLSEVPHGVGQSYAGRMSKERITVSLDGQEAAHVRQCASRFRGGASGYLERLVREDRLREGVDALVRWYAANPGYSEDAEAERIAAAEERGETA